MSFAKEDNLDSEPWFKQFWPWVLIALPLASVIAGLSTLFIAVQNQDALIVEKWQKDGKAIYADNSRMEVASRLGLSGKLSFDSLTGEVFLNLHSENEQFIPPEFLLVKIVHPTLVSRDQKIKLSAINLNRYRGQLDMALDIHKVIYISDEKDSWQIKVKHGFSGSDSIDFSARSNF